ncbi:MAG TPA: N-acetylmuramidase family protein [Polyangium sp.]|nr:N-acetylmuramidase family protein [Polyangium sp.]
MIQVRDPKMRRPSRVPFDSWSDTPIVARRMHGPEIAGVSNTRVLSFDRVRFETMAIEQAQPGGNAANGVLVDPTTLSGRRLPDPPGEALPLVRTDIENAARELGVDAAAIHAVATVESGGRSGFDAKKRPIIRYENHVFRRLTNGRFDKTHKDLSAGYKSAEYKRTHRFAGIKYQDEQWELLTAAFALAPDEAVMSCSWGMFQVMGENYRAIGWTSIDQFVKDMFFSEGQHLRAFLGFCKANRLVPYLKNHQWASFAQRYNGKDFRTNHYDTKLAQAFAQYNRAAR